jgi:pyruvate kinase
MAKVCKETELNYQTRIISGHTVASVETDAVAKYVVELCNELPVKKIVVGTSSGATALSISRHRPKQAIVAFVSSEILQSQLNLSRGVRPVFVRSELPSDRDWLVRAMMEYGVNSKLLKPEDLVVLVSGSGVAGKNRNTIVEVARVFQVRDI